MRSRFALIVLGIVGLVMGHVGSVPSFAAERPADIPTWLQTYMGDGDGQITGVVLQRARALYRQKVTEGAVKNPCYFAMDATRPNDMSDGTPGRRFYIICEAARSFRAISAGHGGGRDLKGIVDFANERRCAKNFGNAMDSFLTTGGAYVTSEIRLTFKGYYRVSPKEDAVLIRSFVQFDGEGDTANARPRQIGGHAAAVLKGICRRRNPASSYADRDGYVPFGTRVDYPGGRSDGCTSWSPSDAQQIIPMVQNNPTTLYIYPEASDIAAVARAVASRQSPARIGSYWNAACLAEIGAPKFWPKRTLEPILAEYKRLHPAPPPQPAPICREP